MMILVDFHAKMEKVLKQMQALVAKVDLDRALEFTKFSEVPANVYLQSPLRRPIHIPVQSLSLGLESLLKFPVGA